MKKLYLLPLFSLLLAGCGDGSVSFKVFHKKAEEVPQHSFNTAHAKLYEDKNNLDAFREATFKYDPSQSPSWNYDSGDSFLASYRYNIANETAARQVDDGLKYYVSDDGFKIVFEDNEKTFNAYGLLTSTVYGNALFECTYETV